MLSKLTSKIIGFGYVNWLISKDVIEWAEEMIDLSYSDENLLILASIKKDSPFYEVEPYIEPALRALNLSRKEGKEAILCYASYYIREIANNKNVRQNVKELAEFCEYSDYMEEIYNFWNLHFAWWDFEYHSKTICQSYWKGATLENIEGICIDLSKKWLITHQITIKY